MPPRPHIASQRCTRNHSRRNRRPGDRSAGGDSAQMSRPQGRETNSNCRPRPRAIRSQGKGVRCAWQVRRTLRHSEGSTEVYQRCTWQGRSTLRLLGRRGCAGACAVYPRRPPPRPALESGTPRPGPQCAAGAGCADAAPPAAQRRPPSEGGGNENGMFLKHCKERNLERFIERSACRDLVPICGPLLLGSTSCGGRPVPWLSSCKQ